MKEGNMHGTPLSRHAGPIVLVAGAFIVITHLALLFVVNRGDVRTMVADPLYQVVSVAYAAAFAGLLIALFAAYARQAREAGTFGGCPEVRGTSVAARWVRLR
jgi:membrane associated rhomboid family serine protease